MNIYIYGDKSFKKEIHKLLDHANIKFKLKDGYVEDLDNVDLLKEAIRSNPNDIYLIDSTKIVDKDSINSKLKFLKPKDGIDKEFLQEHGIGDISVDSMEALGKHISKRLEHILKEEDEEDFIEQPYTKEPSFVAKQLSESNEIEEEVQSKQKVTKEKKEDTIVIDDDLADLLEYDTDLDDEDKEIDNDSESSHIEDFDFDMDDLYKDSSDHLSNDLMSFDQTLNIDEDDFDKIMNLDDIDDLVPVESQTLNTQTKQTLQGDKMSNEFELDALSGIDEKDILQAIEGIDFAKAPSITKPQNKTSEQKIQLSTPNTQNISLGNVDLNQLTTLLSQLLQNKTIDISIKIRD